MSTKPLRHVVLVAAAAAGGWALLGPSTQAPTARTPPVAAIPAPEPPAPRAAPPRRAAARPPARVRQPSAPPPVPADPEALFEGEVPLEELLGTDQAERQAAANARWRQAVEDGGYTAEQIDPAVVEFFQGLELVPVLDEEGLIEGLEIVALESGSVADRSGFARGDRIVEIDGERLQDPADLPRLLVALGPRARLCASRDRRRVCRRVGAG